MSQNIFKNFENFWNENEIKQKAKAYHNYFEEHEKKEIFLGLMKKTKIV